MAASHATLRIRTCLKSKQNKDPPLPRSRAAYESRAELLLPPGDSYLPTVPLLSSCMSHDLSKMTSSLLPECGFFVKFFVSFIQMFRIQQMLLSKPTLLFLCVFLTHRGTVEEVGGRED